ncbi:MAG: hypothetical protein JSS10_08290 [Verrucomicrobia bacterium]|nr:hypothetical protein [Verrucomicrobiota bacterium]
MSFTAYLSNLGSSVSRTVLPAIKGDNNPSSVTKKATFSDDDIYFDKSGVTKEWSEVLEAFSNVVVVPMFAASVITELFRSVMKSLTQEMGLTKNDFQTAVAKLKYAMVSDKKNMVMFRDERGTLRIQPVDLFVGQTFDKQIKALTFESAVLPQEKTLPSEVPAPVPAPKEKVAVGDDFVEIPL